jgi:Transposase DDE domain group 1
MPGRHRCCCALRRIALAHAQFATASCGTLHLKLLKLGALVRIRVRRVKIAFASACAVIPEWRLAAARLALGPRLSPRQTGGTTHGPRDTKPRQPSPPRIRHHDGAGPPSRAAENQGSCPFPRPQV